jgi:sigma-E factor negative regulatory protein RseB
VTDPSTRPLCRPGARFPTVPRFATRFSRGALGAALGLLALGSSPGFLEPARAAPAPEQRSEAQWLEAIRQAAEQQTYRGVFVYTQGDAVRTSRVTHIVDGGLVTERFQPLDGKVREYIRHGDTVECFYHDEKRILTSQANPDSRFPALVSAAPDEVLKYYTFELVGAGRVAGTACEVIRLRPRDGIRYGYELCVEPASGLVLKERLRDLAGNQVDQMAFSEVQIGGRIDPAEVHASWPTDGWSHQQRDVRPVDLDQLGWVIGLPAGFHRLREVARKLLDSDGAAAHETYQSVLSDGVATVSVFIETDSAPSFPLDVPQRRGPASAYALKVGPATVTVVGEVPPETVQAIARGVEFREPH